MHAAVAERLLADPGLVMQARARASTWLDDGSVARPYALAWHALLSRSLEELTRALLEDSERMHDLRQVSPFAGVLDPRTRWRIHREVGERFAHETR